MKIIELGSMVRELQTLALEIRNFCERYDSQLKPVWIPREENFHADDLSRGAKKSIKV